MRAIFPLFHLSGEWEHFVYVGKIAFFGWMFHFGESDICTLNLLVHLTDVPFLVPFLIMGRVTYLHHYLPTLYFAVLMLAHVFDHFIFSSKRYTQKTKSIAFGVIAGVITFTFWWFKGVAFGIDGPVNDHWGLEWRKVRAFTPFSVYAFSDVIAFSQTWNIYNQ